MDIPSILIDLPEEADETIKKEGNILENQIHRKDWVQFFKAMDEFNYTNFDIIQWIKCDDKKLFELEQEEYEPRHRRNYRDYYLTAGVLQQVYIDTINSSIEEYNHTMWSIYLGHQL
jgi:hypothetical protein